MEYDELQHRERMKRVIERVRTVLNVNRHPAYPGDVPHEYNDKYVLAEFLTSTCLAAEINALEYLGLSADHLQQLREWSAEKAVTLRFSTEERCAFDRKETRKVESDTERVTSLKMGDYAAKITNKTVTKVTEYFWNIEVDYKLVAFSGQDLGNGIQFQGRKCQMQLKTLSETPPYPETKIRSPIDTNITFLLHHITENGQVSFSVDREDKNTHTPRRNAGIRDSLEHVKKLSQWSTAVSRYFLHDIRRMQGDGDIDWAAFDDHDSIFVPLVPLFEPLNDVHIKGSEEDTTLLKNTHQSSVVLPLADINRFLEEQQRTLSDKAESLSKFLLDGGDKWLMTVAEGIVAVTCLHLANISDVYRQSVDMIESLLRHQLISAIGKEISAADFTEYMIFHERKLFNRDVAPRSLSYAVRCPDHCPEGNITVEMVDRAGQMAQPIHTHVRCMESLPPLQFALDAATTVQLQGPRFIHGYVSHRFSTSSGSSYSLVARARQFSSFILMVGKLGGADLFLPKQAIIVENKDVLKLPLIFDVIPTAKEFKAAISSLSAEMQRFSKAYRSMQLEGSMFAVVLIQIKPQLEAVLNLPPDSLLKEIALSEDVKNLFVEYQIPSDLLSYDGEEASSVREKVAVVREQVSAMKEMIAKMKKKDLDEAIQEAAHAAVDISSSDGSYSEEEEGEEEEGLDLGYIPTLTATSSRAPSIFRRVTSLFSRSAAPQMERGSIVECDGDDFGTCSDSMDDDADSWEEEKAPVKTFQLQKKSMKEEKEVRNRDRHKRDFAPSPKLKPSPSKAREDDHDKQSQSRQETQQKEKDEERENLHDESKEEPSKGSGDECVDQEFDATQLPKLLDEEFLKHGEDANVRPTIIKVGDQLEKRHRPSLLADEQHSTLFNDEQECEQRKAYAFLDSLTRSGALSIKQSEVHVMMAATHCFDQTLVDTVIQDNINPIEKVERTSMVMSTVIQGKRASALVDASQQARARMYSPSLFGDV